jgi:hypothetical protein
MRYLYTEVIYEKHLYLIDLIIKNHFQEYTKDFNLIESNFKNLHIERASVSESSFYKNEANISLFETEITKKLSIYNTFEKINLTDMAKFLHRHNKLYLYEHYFVWFKDYFQHYLKSINVLLHSNGYLSIPWRYYIAIMAASTMRSSYVLKIMEENFIEVGGDESWLIHGLDVVPEKIVRLGRINNILAHQPWILNADDIREINADKEQKDHSYWNINELMHAVLIMTHFHKISNIVESMKFHLNNNCNDSNDTGDLKVACILKEKLIQNLEICISECDDDNISNITENDLELGELKKFCFTSSIFTKHINSFCNVYNDFDPHSEEYRSYLVIIPNIRNSTGKIKDTISSKPYSQKE